MRKEIDWEELNSIWRNSSHAKHIVITISELRNEIEEKVTPFEKEQLKADLRLLKSNWESTEKRVSRFELESMQNDLNLIMRSISKLKNFFKNKGRE